MKRTGVLNPISLASAVLLVFITITLIGQYSTFGSVTFDASILNNIDLLQTEYPTTEWGKCLYGHQLSSTNWHIERIEGIILLSTESSTAYHCPVLDEYENLGSIHTHPRGETSLSDTDIRYAYLSKEKLPSFQLMCLYANEKILCWKYPYIFFKNESKLYARIVTFNKLNVNFI